MRYLIIVSLLCLAVPCYALDYNKLTDAEKKYVDNAIRGRGVISRMMPSKILSMSNEEIASTAANWADSKALALDKQIKSLQEQKAALLEK